MAAASDPIAALREAGSGIAAVLADILVSRFELAGLEAREAAVRLAQVAILACLGAGLLVVGAALVLLAVILAAPPQWRAVTAGGGAALAIATGAVYLLRLRARLARLPGLFAATAEALKKDRACF